MIIQNKITLLCGIFMICCFCLLHLYKYEPYVLGQWKIVPISTFMVYFKIFLQLLLSLKLEEISD